MSPPGLWRLEVGSFLLKCLDLALQVARAGLGLGHEVVLTGQALVQGGQLRVGFRSGARHGRVHAAFREEEAYDATQDQGDEEEEVFHDRGFSGERWVILIPAPSYFKH
jgi:hypothetical protein